MISNNQQEFKKTTNVHMTEFVRLKRETKLQVKERKLPDEPPPEKRPPPPKMQMRQVQATQNIAPKMNMPNLDIPLQTSHFMESLVNGVQVGAGKAAVAKINTNVIPLVRIPPQYPMRASRRHIEGWVKIEFTIDQEGAVKEAVVVGAQPSNIFNRAALRAIKRWKFKPHILGGKAVEQRAVQVLQFKLKK